MKGYGYSKVRINFSCMGISTFRKSQFIENWDDIQADVTILGIPFDPGTQWRFGARFGPKSNREASMLFSFDYAGAHGHEDGVTYLDSSVRLVNISDAYSIHTKTIESYNNIELGVKNFRAECLTSEFGWVTIY